VTTSISTSSTLARQQFRKPTGSSHRRDQSSGWTPEAARPFSGVVQNHGGATQICNRKCVAPRLAEARVLEDIQLS
jgi:hypothetical protein